MRVNENLCFVRKEPKNRKKIIELTKYKWRHDKCVPGSIKWLQSAVGKTSQMRQYFLNGKETHEK
jgi:hypothetical protein